MQEKKKMIILLIILVIISIINTIIFKKIIDLKDFIDKQNQYQNQAKTQSETYYNTTSLKEIDNRSTFYGMKSCVEQYFYTLNRLWTNLNEQTVYGENQAIGETGYKFNESVSKELLDLLAEEYKNEANLNENNIKDKYTYLRQGKVILDKAYQYDVKSGLSIFLVEGYYTDGINKDSFKMMLITDRNNNTFAIYPEEYLVKHGLDKVELGDKVELTNDINEIPKNDSNQIRNVIVTDEKVAEDLFYLYKFNMKYDIEEAYNMLDEEYREKRFGSLKNYENYIEENYLNLLSQMSGYEVTKQEDYKQYTCVDKKGYYYIFKQKNICLDYSVILDTYTIDLPEFTEKYEVATTQEKVALNIQKIAEALNSKDYNYVYSKLADEFINNNFKTLQEFEEYAEKTFEMGSQVEFIKYTEANNLYTYKISLKGSKKIVTKTIIMQLQEGTDFVISFNVE